MKQINEYGFCFLKLKERLALLRVAQKEDEERKRNEIIQAKVVS